jgi:nucleoside-diphosphate-sugar epimerase
MKVILAGSTGFIGREVLTQCLKNPSITSILALSRRELPGTISDPRLKVVILKDFASYPDSVLQELASADACIWYEPYGSIYIYKLYSLLWPN